ncbi:MAG: ABC transporter permease [Chitinispirillaceae bacterium]|nr:ABC transporter permease [Chitinispirillaceae bacterium]
MNSKRGFSSVVFTLVVLFFYLPLVILILFSFNHSKTMSWGGLSFRWYEELFFHSRTLWNSVFNSVIVALSSGLISTIVGTLGAVGISWYDFRGKRMLQVAGFLPLILPEIIIGVSLLIFFAGIKLKLSLFTVFLAHTTFNIPFVLLMVTARLEEFDFSIVEAAYDLGAREIDALLRIIIPLAFPGILSGFLIAVTLSLEDFVITFFVAGPGASTLPLHVYSMIRFGVSPVINALSVVIIAATAVLALSAGNVFKYIVRK